MIRHYGICLLGATRIQSELLTRDFSSGVLSSDEAAQKVMEFRAKFKRVAVIGKNDPEFGCAEQAEFDENTLVEWAREKSVKLTE